MRFILQKWLRSWLLISLLASMLSVQDAASAPNNAWQFKVDAQVLAESEEGESEFLVFFEQQANLENAHRMKTKTEKGAYVYSRLTEIARTSQAPVVRVLESSGAEFRSFWVANMIWVRGDARLVETLARRPDVRHLYSNPRVRLDLPPQEVEPADESMDGPADTTQIEWNISLVGAPEVWAAGYTGQGAVIGGQDTGYEWDHPALKGQYRGWDSVMQTADHNYNWHDAIHTGDGGVCELSSPEPCDDGYHGTHTMGIMVGDDGGANQIGMAPGAKWIGCRNMDRGVGTPATYSECYEWFIAPYPYGGNSFTDGDPSKAPHVINNSWSCPVREGCTQPDVLLAVVQSVRAAGILTVHSAGNAGSACSTVYTPAAIYNESFSVGSTGQTDIIDTFSSRGPVTIDGSNRLKPDITAPGRSIRSSIPPRPAYPNLLYESHTGTSMAAPHVAGLVALLISAQPGLAGQVDMLEAMMTSNALPRTTSQTCGGIPGYQVPNNTYGWGRIDALASVQNALQPFEIQKSLSSSWVKTNTPYNYTIEIQQHYPLEMTQVVISDVIPANVDFIGATEPYTLNGDTVVWNLDTLEAGEQRSLQMTVTVPYEGSWIIVNQDYGVRSAEAPAIVFGSPISITAATSIHIFPLVPNTRQ